MRWPGSTCLNLFLCTTTLGGCDTASGDITSPSDDLRGGSTCVGPSCGGGTPPPVVLSIGGKILVGDVPVRRGDAIYMLVDVGTGGARTGVQPVSADGRYGFSWTQASEEICSSSAVAVTLQDGRTSETPLFDVPRVTCSGDLDGPTIEFPYAEPLVIVSGTVHIRESPAERPVPARIELVHDSLAWTTWADENGDYELSMPWVCVATALADYSEPSPTDPTETLSYNSGPAWPLFDVAPAPCEGDLAGPDLVLVWTGPGFDPRLHPLR